MLSVLCDVNSRQLVPLHFTIEGISMICNPDVLKSVPLFALLDAEESAVLAAQVELKEFAPRERIYKLGQPGGQAYVLLSGRVRVTTVDEDHQEVVVDEPRCGEFFGFASMLERRPTTPTPSRWNRRPAWKYPGTTSRCCWNASRWRGWICSHLSAGNCMRLRRSFACGPAAIRMNSSKKRPRWANGSPTRWRASVARGPSSSPSASSSLFTRRSISS